MRPATQSFDICPTPIRHLDLRRQQVLNFRFIIGDSIRYQHASGIERFPLFVHDIVSLHILNLVPPGQMLDLPGSRVRVSSGSGCPEPASAPKPHESKYERRPLLMHHTASLTFQDDPWSVH